MAAPSLSSGPVRRTRLRRQMLALATALLVGGAVVLVFLARIPLPLRIAVGITDLIASAVLFLVVRQKFSVPPPASGASSVSGKHAP